MSRSGANTIEAGTVTKKRLIRIGAVIFQKIEPNVRPTGFYKKKNFCKENFCLGNEYSLSDVRDVLSFCKAVYRNTASSTSARSAGINPKDAMARAHNVLRVRIGTQMGFPGIEEVFQFITTESEGFE
jgi:hypothetical protein